MSFGDHAAHVVMNTTSDNGAEDYPQEYDRTEAGPHQRTEDRSCPCDIQQLNKVQLPKLERNKIHAVLSCDRRCFPVIRTEHPLDQSSVENVAQDQYD